jgi:hypothetical protein
MCSLTLTDLSWQLRNNGNPSPSAPAAPVAGAFFRSDLSTAARGVFNMTVVVVTSGSVLLCLFAAKRLL